MAVYCTELVHDAWLSVLSVLYRPDGAGGGTRHQILADPKGHLILKCPFCVFKLTQRPKKIARISALAAKKRSVSKIVSFLVNLKIPRGHLKIN